MTETTVFTHRKSMSGITTYYLEMTDRADMNAKICRDASFRIEEISRDKWELNKYMYEQVGGDWQWIDKLPWTDQQWQDYAGSEAIRTFIAYCGEEIAGYFELSTQGNEVEIIYFGLTRDFVGRRLGGALLTRALETAWEMNPERVWVHTCSLDHPAALKNYEARGMTLYKTETEELP